MRRHEPILWQMSPTVDKVRTYGTQDIAAPGRSWDASTARVQNSDPLCAAAYGRAAKRRPAPSEGRAGALADFRSEYSYHD